MRLEDGAKTGGAKFRRQDTGLTIGRELPDPHQMLLTDGGFRGRDRAAFQEKGSGAGRRGGGNQASATKSAGGLRIGIVHYRTYYIIATGSLSTAVRELQRRFLQL